MKRIQLVFLLSMVFVCAGNAFAQSCPPATTGAPTPTAPAAMAVLPAGNITFAWTAPTAAGLTGYEVYIIEQAQNTQTRVCQTTSTSCIASITAPSIYQWFVRALYTSCPQGQGVDSARRSMAVGCAGNPTNLSPGNGATNVSTTPTLTWSDTGADSYDIYLTAGNVCGTQPVATATTNSFNLPPLNAGTNYSWKVVAKKGTLACQASSACATFTTAAAACPATAPTLTAPANNATVPAGAVTLSWNAVANTTSYDVFVGLDGATPTRGATTTNTSVTQVFANGREVAWYVIANAPQCTPRQSATQTFRTPSCPNGVANINAPSNGQQLSTLTVNFAWSSVTDAVGYDVFLSTNGGAFSQAFTTPAGTTSASRLLEAGSYSWYVRTRFAGICPATESARSNFTIVQNTCPTDRPTLDSPANNATSDLPVTFQWTGVARATGYKLYVQQANSTATLAATTSSTTTRHTVLSLPAGALTWFVRATFENCPETESDRRSLTIQGASNCPTAAPTLTSPANGASDVATPVTFRWSAVTNATRYRLVAAIDGGSAATVALTTDTQASVAVPAGSAVEWYAEALFDNCPATQSAHFRFSTRDTDDTCPSNPGTPTLTSPANGAANVSSPVTFQWTAVSGATGYRLLASVDNSALSIIGNTANTSLSVSLPQGFVVWFVQALFGDCPSTTSGRGTFTITSGGSCTANPAPTLVAPASGASNVTSPVEFRWNPATGASSYELYVAINDSNNFLLVGSTSETSLTRIMPAGPISWYVAAQFIGCPEVKSATSRFTVVDPNACPDASITLNAPANNATVTSPVTLSWTAIANATAYRVWASLNGGTPNLIARVTSTSTQVSIPSGVVDWFVEGQRDDCPSVLSGRSRFTVESGANCSANQAPTLVAPTGTVTSPVTFSWNAAANALGYKLWASINGQPFADIGFTTSTSLQRELPPGTYGWFLETFFAGCPPVNSARGAFTVQSTTPRCITDAPSIISPADGATNVTSPVTFLWSSVPEAELYRVYVFVGNSTSPILLGTTQETSLTRPLPPGTTFWLVEAAFRNGCNPTRSNRARFTIPEGENCPTAPPTLVSPVNDATDESPVTLVWNPVSGAVRYVVIARIGGGAPTPIGETSGTQLARELPPGRTEWWVLAFFATCRPLESAHAFFEVTTPPGCDNRRPILLTPPNGARDVTSPVTFSWTRVARATGYKLWAAIGAGGAGMIAETTSPNVTINVPPGRISWFVQAIFAGCPPTESSTSDFVSVPAGSIVCRTPEKPTANVPGQVLSGTEYGVRWTPVPGVNVYELQESTTADFSGATTQTITGALFATFTHTATGSPARYHYRVRAVSSCNDDRGPYSDVVTIFIMPPRTTNNQQSASAEVGSQQVIVQSLFLPGQTPGTTFMATPNKPWLTVTPSSGTLPAEGITLTVTADPANLNLGTNTAQISVTYGTSGSGKQVHQTTPKNYNVSISLVTPVSPTGKDTPPPDTLIIPAVAHADGANNSSFESDVRITNLSAEAMRYRVTFTPSATDGTLTGNSAEIEIESGATTALDDVLADFFGNGNGGGVTGSLEIRPLTTSDTTTAVTTTSGGSLGVERLTVASSRTFNTTPTGTFGQFVPAIPYSQFISRFNDAGAKNVLSLQQIAQSSAYRTNFGFVEASGEPAELMLSVFNTGGDRLAQIPVSLLAGEHKQLNQLLAEHNITLADGRVEVEVTSDTGRVTAYASVLDSATSDPLLVSPVLKGDGASNRYTIPGVADLNNVNASWRTDMRIFNAAETPTLATLTYYPIQNSGPAIARQVTIAPGEVHGLDNVLQTLFGTTNSGGSMVVTTPNPSHLVTTARTYNQTGNGTYGQFIPGVTPEESVGANERSLQILQLEQSNRFRTNIGVAETSGQPVSLELTVDQPDTRVSPRITLDLTPNEYRQFSLTEFGLTNVYNGRVSVRVISGEGRVTAYGSVIDEQTQDPTYVPAQ